MGMPQDVADRLERGPAVQHLGGQAVTELVRAACRCIHAGTLYRAADDAGYAAGTPKSLDRCLDTKEHTPAST